jgi:hypothetical protein
MVGGKGAVLATLETVPKKELEPSTEKLATK